MIQGIDHAQITVPKDKELSGPTPFPQIQI